MFSYRLFSCIHNLGFTKNEWLNDEWNFNEKSESKLEKTLQHFSHRLKIIRKITQILENDLYGWDQIKCIYI